jgi:hypothetical protein
VDPNACLQRFLDALEDNDASEAWHAHLDLSVWLTRGGFEPSDTEELATFRAWKRLDKYTSVGCYPIAYTHHGRCLCAPCASAVSCPEQDCDVNWEGSLECEQCGEPIESAYGSPEEIADERTAEDWAKHSE